MCTVGFMSTGIMPALVRVRTAGGGNYQSLINAALREHMKSANEPLEKTLRRVLREELREASQPSAERTHGTPDHAACDRPLNVTG